jgi:hypothetical protein
MSSIPSLLNIDGAPFTRQQIETTGLAIEGMDDAARVKYRNQNSFSIVHCHSPRLLIVSGPGTGKSYLFRDRIKFWLSQYPEHKIFVSSFVRKLVADLQGEIENDREISNSDVERIKVSTLHGLARSLIERSKGIPEIRFAHHVRMLDSYWTPVIWNDALQFHDELDQKHFEWRHYKIQCDMDQFDAQTDWVNLRGTYFRLLSFFNCASFVDTIWIATRAVEEDTSLVAHEFWIVDEYQDFNFSEDHLIRVATAQAQGILIAGDDDQALYERMKSSSTEIILSYYNGNDFSKAMLPFCNRCSFHICLAAAHYIAANRTDGSVEKVFQPQELDLSANKVQIVAVANPSTVHLYIKNFLDSHEAELTAHAESMRSGGTTDPFLLLLSPMNGLPFFKQKKGVGADEKIRDLIARWTIESPSRSLDYRRVLTHFQAGLYPADNLLVRMVLQDAGRTAEQVHGNLVEAFAKGENLIDVLRRVDPSIIELLDETVKILKPPFDPASDTVRRLEAIMRIEDPKRLARELELDPIFVLDEDFEVEVVDFNETEEKLPLVELMSIAKSKGLSAKHVMILGCDDMNMKEELVSPLSFYVAMTRARESLHLVTSLKARGCKSAAAHFADIPEEHCDYIAYTKEGAKDLGSLAGFNDQFGRWARMMKGRINR